MAKTPEEMAASMIANLADKTGRSLPEWLEITRACGLHKHGKLVSLLKKEHGITHGFANLIAHQTLQAGKPAATGDDLVGAQYAEAKAPLRRTYDKLVTAVGEFGNDVELSPKKTYVSLRRNKQFGIVQASTKTRVDVGFESERHRTDGTARSIRQFQRHVQPSRSSDSRRSGRRRAPRLAPPSLRSQLSLDS